MRRWGVAGSWAALGVAMVAALSGCGVLTPRQQADGAVSGDARAASPGTVAALPDRLPSLTRYPARRMVAVAGAVESRHESDPAAGALLPPGWEPYTIHPSKARTRYRLETLPEGTKLRAEADVSASGLMAKVSIDTAATPMLAWRWKIDSLLEGADVTDRYAEDSPVRIILAFDGDKSALPVRDRMFFEQVRLFTGRDMPYATLMYVWDNKQPVDAIVQNPHTGRVRKVVVASGGFGVREWLTFRRNVVEDYRRAYGVDPGRLIGVGLMTDTDNTKTRVTAWYGDITLER